MSQQVHCKNQVEKTKQAGMTVANTPLATGSMFQS